MGLSLGFRGEYRISESGVGPGNCYVLKHGVFACIRAFSPLFMKLEGPQKGGGGA